MTDEQLDILAALNVMKWDVWTRDQAVAHMIGGQYVIRLGVYAIGHSTWSPTTDIRHAMELLEKLEEHKVQEPFWLASLIRRTGDFTPAFQPGWACELRRIDGKPHATHACAYEDTAARAITLAALRAKGVEL